MVDFALARLCRDKMLFARLFVEIKCFMWLFTAKSKFRFTMSKIMPKE